MPAQMADRWEHRKEPEPGQGQLYWHMLLRDHPDVQALVQAGQGRLAGFGGLHFTPVLWLHMTTVVVGAADEFSADQIEDMIGQARRALARIPPITITFGKILYHPEAVMLGTRPAGALDPVFEAVQDATRSATGKDGLVEHQPWTPHVTLAYSTGVQPAGPIIAALGRELPGCDATISCISLINQDGPERHWNWRSIAEIPFGRRLAARSAVHPGGRSPGLVAGPTR
jgi:2'-5' RNA ligase